jgi:poly-gamma-glutamate capsule biosynthesis protein CapA/YwtB (metallophosphatase superfamily)
LIIARSAGRVKKFRETPPMLGRVVAAVLVVGSAVIVAGGAKAAPPPNAPTVFAFGDAPALDGPPPGAAVVGAASTTSRQGLVIATADGGVHVAGDAADKGSMAGQHLNRPIVAVATTPAGNGYWMAATDGGIFTFGDAPYLGSTGNIRLNQPIVGMAATATGKGYWLVASDGGIFTFGDAAFLGSTGDRRLNEPVVGMGATTTGRGYWLVARDGGIFTFGDATFLGSTGDRALNEPIAGMRPTPTDAGYRLVARDGGVFTFGDARFHGSAATTMADGLQAVAITNGGATDGYWIVAADATARVAFAGDVHGEGPVRDLLDRGENPLAAMADRLQAADLVAVNLETPVAHPGTGTPQSKQYVFLADVELLDALARSGVDVVNLANNHALDHGPEALLETIDHARQAGLTPVGAGANAAEAYRPAYFRVRNRTIAVLGLSRVVPPGWAATATKAGVASAYDERTTMQAIRSAKAQADDVVVMIHWGVELARCPGDDIVGLAHRLHQAGATVVAGHHPHVLQGISNGDEGVTAFSLGNFVWYHDEPPTYETGVLEVELGLSGGRPRPTFLPARVGGDGRTRFLGGAEADAARSRVGPACAG